MSATIKLANYLFMRLRQLGVTAIHGVPGDYNLDLLDYVEPNDLLWVGNASELNAGYAADGYARMKGMGALITTFGVGELSAINAIACAYTERAAVVHIVGTPRRDSQDARLMVHHTLGDGDFRHFSQMSSHVTVSQVNLLDPKMCPRQIDEVLETCLVHSRPVYIEIPMDMVTAQVSVERLDTPIRKPESVDSNDNFAALDVVLEKIRSAKNPLIMIDCETRPLGIADDAQRFVELTKWPTFTTVSGNGLIDMTLPNVYGIYRGDYADPQTKEYVQSSDLALFFGPHLASINTYNWSGVPKKEVSISFTYEGIHVGNRLYRDNDCKKILFELWRQLDQPNANLANPKPDLPKITPLQFSQLSSNASIKHDSLWRVLSGFLRPGDTIMAETGTPAYGARDMSLPKHARLLVPITWLSIGYMLPACQGAALAQRELLGSPEYPNNSGRTILFIGDGSFQMTAQELGTIIRHKLNVVLFLINNDGYTIERCIHGKNQKYNDISYWRYLKAPSLFGAPEDSYTGSARTYGELEQILGNKTVADGHGLRMIEIFMDRNDAPVGPLQDLLDMQKNGV